MAKVLIKKFTLIRNGVRYPAGGVVELPDDEAAALAASSPKEFEVINVAAEPAIKVAGEPVEGIDLEKLTVAELKKFAAGNGIDIGDAAKKQDIINAITHADADEQEGLPPVNPEATVK